MAPAPADAVACHPNAGRFANPPRCARKPAKHPRGRSGGLAAPGATVDNPSATPQFSTFGCERVFFQKKILDTDGRPALKGVPGNYNSNKPFNFNMFRRFSHIHTHLAFGDNSPRLNEEWKFRLSTSVEKAVDNFAVALEAGFSAPIKNRRPYSKRLPGWMDCG